MSFEDFRSDFLKENHKLKIALAITLIVSSVGTVTSLMQKKYYLYKGGAVFEERPLAEEVCRTSFISLTSGNPNPSLISNGILKLVKKEPFDLTIDKILQIKSLEVGTCKIVLKSQGELLAFKITLDSNDSNPFYYKLIQLDEINVKKEEI